MPFFLAEIIPQTDVEPLLQLVQTSRLINGGGTAISRYEKGSELGRPQTYCALAMANTTVRLENEVTDPNPSVMNLAYQ
jgi:hypothetical protein